jgi:hypothetical protein
VKTKVHRWFPLIKMLLIGALVLSNIYIGMRHPDEASAHMFLPHWHKGGAAIHLGVWNFGVYSAEADRAIRDHFNKISLLYWDYPNAHTDISVYDETRADGEGCGYEDPVQNDGIHLTHSHVVFNRNCAGDTNFIQGIFCQELGHAWGQDHHNEQNSCMGLTYQNQNGYYITDHDNLDFTDRYRYH